MTKKEVLKKIREFCIQCMGGHDREVLNCTCGPLNKTECPLYIFRMGNDPYPSKSKSEAARKRFGSTESS